MKRILFIAFLFFSLTGFSQSGGKWVRAFPITDYQVPLSDTVILVQIQLPDGQVILEKTMAVVRGVYKNNHTDTVTIGAGRCHLIKGDYYYFSIRIVKGGRTPQKDDLLYTTVEQSPTYTGQLVRLASHYIRLVNIYDEPFYDVNRFFAIWGKTDEQAMLDSMASDIRFTGKYFIDNDQSQDRVVAAGKYKGKKIFAVMAACTREDLVDFFEYIIVRPRLYAGGQWKVSEIFATWVGENAPTVIRE